MFPDSDQVELLPGSSWAVRRSASEIRNTLGDLSAARRAAERLEAVTAGECWQGEAFDAFRALIERQPLTIAIDHATDCMHEAADRLDWYAERFDEHQGELGWCRRRLHSVVAAARAEQAAAESTGAPPPDRWPEIRRILDRAADIWRDHRRVVDMVAETFDRLDDEPTFATPPPSNFEKVAGGAWSFVEGVLDGAWSFAVGLAEGVRDLVVGLVEIAALLNPLTLPGRLVDLIQNWDQVVAVLRYAWDNPGEFFGELGKAMLDWEMLMEDPARWVGRRIPDILLTVATGGMGKVGSTAAQSARFLRGANIADRTVGRVGLGTTRYERATTAAQAVSTGPGAFARLAGLGGDASAMARVSDIGAWSRTDTVAGRLAARFDDVVPHGDVIRQMPGAVKDEIKAFTSVPQGLLQDRLPPRASAWLDNTAVSSTLDAKLSGGLTSTLGMVDGLLAGAPAMSPKLQAAMAGLLGAEVLDSLAGVDGFFDDVKASAGVGS